MLTQGSIEAISQHGTDSQKKKYLPKLLTGQWSGTMNLTEPHAGSDVGSLNTSAIKNDDETYDVFARGTDFYSSIVDYYKENKDPDIVVYELNEEEESEPSSSDLVRMAVPNDSETGADHKI